MVQKKRRGPRIQDNLASTYNEGESSTQRSRYMQNQVINNPIPSHHIEITAPPSGGD